MSDVEFRIKRKKKVTDKDNKDQVGGEELNKDKSRKRYNKRERAERKRRFKAILPKYEIDKVISRILEEATNNENYFKPMQLILTEGKKDLVRVIRQ
jgi:uncharacterized Fe-S cluster-containing protein